MRSAPVAVLVALFLLRSTAAQDRLDEAQAIEHIHSLGGAVILDKKVPDHPVTGVKIGENKRFNDKYLHLLKSFPKLATLNLENSAITDAGLVQIGGLKTLRELSLFGIQTTDAGLRALRGLENLTRLTVSGDITDAGFKELFLSARLLNRGYR